VGLASAPPPAASSPQVPARDAPAACLGRAATRAQRLHDRPPLPRRPLQAALQPPPPTGRAAASSSPAGRRPFVSATPRRSLRAMPTSRTSAGVQFSSPSFSLNAALCSRRPGAPAQRTRAPAVPRRAAPLLSRAEDARRRAPCRPCCSTPGCPVHASLRRLTAPRPQQCLDPPTPVAMSFTLPAALVTVRVLLHDGQLIRGMFVCFDPVWNPILRDCVEVHPQAGRHVPGPLVFPRVAIASLAVEPVSSPSLPSASVGAPSLALSAHTVPSPLPPL
jgi:small nuclear ribonucleoprotein (snRNP)-like protein